MARRYFGTDGIRAKAGEFPLNAQTLRAIGRAIGEKVAGKILVGQDTRMSSPWIFEHLKAGIATTGSTIQDAGVIPTPGVALLTRTGDYAGGVMISASHNPYEDNGIKVFASDGTKVNDAVETEIERVQKQPISERELTKAKISPTAATYAGETINAWSQGGAKGGYVLTSQNLIVGTESAVKASLDTKSKGSLSSSSSYQEAMKSLSGDALARFYIEPRAAALKREIPSFETTPKEHPLRREFSRLHAVSAACNLSVFAGGVALVILL